MYTALMYMCCVYGLCDTVCMHDVHTYTMQYMYVLYATYMGSVYGVGAYMYCVCVRVCVCVYIF